MASSSATTRSAWSRSAATRASVPAAIASRVSDARRTTSRRTSSTRTLTADRRSGTTSEETTSAIMRSLTCGAVPRLFARCSPSRHHEATARPRCLRTLRASTIPPVDVPGGTPTCFVRSLVAAASCSPRWRCRCCSSAPPRPPRRRPRRSSPRPPSTATAPPSSSASTRCASARSSSSRRPSPSTTRATARAPGRTDFVNGVVDFARHATPRTSRPTPQPPKPFLYFPTVVAPITVSYNLEGVKLKLSPETTAKIFSAHDHDLGRRRDQGRQPEGASCPSTAITVVHRSRRLRHDRRTSPAG